MSILCEVDSLVILLIFFLLFLCKFSCFSMYFCIKSNKDLFIYFCLFNLLQFEHLQWTKGDQLLYPSRYGRILLHTTLTKDEDWYSSLTIKELKASDTSDYTFTVKTGPAITTMTRSLVVLPKHGTLNFVF